MGDEGRPPPEQDKATGRFVAGNNGGGRPKGSRNKLGEMFLNNLQTLWEREGKTVLEEARKEKPMEFAKMIAGILPKELLVRRAPEEEMTDDELAATIENLGELASKLRASGEGDSPTHEGSTTPN